MLSLPETLDPAQSASIHTVVNALEAAALGVATLSYAPFTFFNILNPLISILFGFAGIRMLKQ
jgi:Na+/H+ antiporter NhaC